MFCVCVHDAYNIMSFENETKRTNGMDGGIQRILEYSLDGFTIGGIPPYPIHLAKFVGGRSGIVRPTVTTTSPPSPFDDSG